MYDNYITICTDILVLNTHMELEDFDQRLTNLETANRDYRKRIEQLEARMGTLLVEVSGPAITGLDIIPPKRTVRGAVRRSYLVYVEGLMVSHNRGPGHNWRYELEQGDHMFVPQDLTFVVVHRDYRQGITRTISLRSLRVAFALMLYLKAKYRIEGNHRTRVYRWVCSEDEVSPVLRRIKNFNGVRDDIANE